MGETKLVSERCPFSELTSIRLKELKIFTENPYPCGKISQHYGAQREGDSGENTENLHS